MNIDTQLFTRADLLTFGQYLLSAKRRKKYAAVSHTLLKERLTQVNHADIENWLEEHIEPQEKSHN